MALRLDDKKALVAEVERSRQARAIPLLLQRVSRPVGRQVRHPAYEGP